MQQHALSSGQQTKHSTKATVADDVICNSLAGIPALDRGAQTPHRKEERCWRQRCVVRFEDRVQGWSLLARNWIAARMELPHANRGVSCITSRPTRQQEERGHCDAGSYASSRCHERQSTESAGEASREGPHASYDGRTKDGFPCHHLSFWSTRVMRTPVVCSY